MKSAITLDFEDAEGAEDFESMEDVYTKFESLFNSLMNFLKAAILKS